jgi:prophage tail gpP-like protein
MITIKINRKEYTFFETYSIDLHFNAISSSFTFTALFEPDSKVHRDLFKPLSFPLIEIFESGKLILTGYIVNNKFNKSAKSKSIPISGYSKTGLLEDCKIPQSVYPIQFENLSLVEIANKLCNPYGINVIVDSSVTEEANAIFDIEAAKETDTVKAYLASLCNQKNLSLSHNEKGDLLITRVKANSNPVQFYKNYTNATLDTNGQGMFSEVLVMKQSGIDTDNAGEQVIANPFITRFRSSTVIQSSGTDNDTELVAKNVLSKQLQNISLSLNTDKITFDNGDLIRPNNIITIQDNELYLFRRTKFFIESVTLRGDKNSDTASLKCVLPEVYTKETPVNIFE